MGNCFSDPSSESKPIKGQGQRLGSGPVQASAPSAANNNSIPPAPGRIASTSGGPPRTLGGGAPGNVEGDGAARDRALRAAEERAKAASSKGVNASNPKAGQLSAKLKEERKTPLSPRQENDRMMDRGEWN